MTEIKMPTKEQILKASERCEDAKITLQELFPEAFKEDEKEILTKEFKEEMKEVLEKVHDLVFVDYTDDCQERAKWAIARLCYTCIPNWINDEMGKPYEDYLDDCQERAKDE